MRGDGMKAWIWRGGIALVVHGALGVVDPGRPHSHLIVTMAVFVAVTALGGITDEAKDRSR